MQNMRPELTPRTGSEEAPPCPSCYLIPIRHLAETITFLLCKQDFFPWLFTKASSLKIKPYCVQSEFG